MPMPEGLRAQVELAPMTTWRVGGPARWFWEGPAAEAAPVLAWCAAQDLAWAVIGAGSNLLVDDGGFDGVVLRLCGNERQVVLDEGLVMAAAEVPMPLLAMTTARAGWSGLEWMCGIPGTVGGGIAMNAGLSSRPHCDIASHLEWIDLLGADGARVRIPAQRLRFAYRRCGLPPGLVVAAAFRLVRAGDAQQPLREIQEQLAARKAKQPLTARTAGSTFASPAGQPAGRLLEAAGLKGVAIGGARVSAKHANWIEAEAGCRAADLVALIARMRAAVLAHSGQALEPEVRRLPNRPWPWQEP